MRDLLQRIYNGLDEINNIIKNIKDSIDDPQREIKRLKIDLGNKKEKLEAEKQAGPGNIACLSSEIRGIEDKIMLLEKIDRKQATFPRIQTGDRKKAIHKNLDAVVRGIRNRAAIAPEIMNHLLYVAIKYMELAEIFDNGEYFTISAPSIFVQRLSDLRSSAEA
ncbi:hypothetical protein [Paraburkholderia hayleyella]|uniref:hypothetical protein n=1 Tax=Paraburkholderia hayleyella TaxID=2152889 RepID=UPI0012920263|nr:hypothetical protein [Paraburkholderia hayleyella]